MIHLPYRLPTSSLTLFLLGGCFNAPTTALDTDGDTEATATTAASTGGMTAADTAPDDGTGGDLSTSDSADDTGTDTSDTVTDDTGSGQTGVDDTGTTDADSSGDGSTTGGAPSVVDVEPAPGTMGVVADQAFTLTFSESMDTTSVEAALGRSDFGALTLDWNGDNTVLTLSPAGLAYATGTSPIAVEALEYTLSLDTSATDIDGTALASAFESNFFTARQITTSLDHDPAYTGGVVSNGTLQAGSGGNPVVGDHDDNLARRGFMGFSISSIPAGVIAFINAEVRAEQSIVSGDPMPGLGTISIHHIAPELLPGGAFASAEVEDLGLWSDEDSFGANNTKMAVVTDNVEFDYGNAHSHTQFRLQFATATNFNGAIDRCRYNGEVLEVTYLIP